MRFLKEKIISQSILIPNKEDNLDLYNNLDLGDFKSSIRCIRDNCGPIAGDLYDYLKTKGHSPTMVRGFFKTDTLDLLDKYDLTPKERVHFESIYGNNFKNNLIVDYVNKYGDNIDEFYLIPHSWIKLDGLILDPSYKMFMKGINKPITKSNYIEETKWQ